jgi:hypothetical protein
MGVKWEKNRREGGETEKGGEGGVTVGTPP